MSAVPERGEVTIESLTQDHLDEILEIERLSYRFPWTPGVFAECLRVGYCLRGVWCGQRLAGYCVMSVGAGEAHILNLCVDPGYRRCGLAQQLLEHMLVLATRLGAHSVLLEVRPSNRAARALYRAMDFRHVGTRTGYYPDQEGREDAWILERPLQ